MLLAGGIWVISHGSSNPKWVQQVREAVAKVNVDLPVVLSFLELVEGQLIEEGIREFEQMGIQDVLAIPLFVSSGSSHIEEIEYLLGLKNQLPFASEEQPYAHNLDIRLSSPMDDHPLILEIIRDRALALSKNPQREQLVLAAHGCDLPHLKPQVDAILNRTCAYLQQEIPFFRVTYGTLHPDNLRQVVEQSAAQYPELPVLVLPLFLSEGYFTRKAIPSVLEGLTYTYRGEAYLPHPNISLWLEQMAREEISQQV